MGRDARKYQHKARIMQALIQEEQADARKAGFRLGVKQAAVRLLRGQG